MLCILFLHSDLGRVVMVMDLEEITYWQDIKGVGMSEEHLVDNTTIHKQVVGYGSLVITRYVETLWTYKRKEVKTVCVPGGKFIYRAYSEDGGSPYTGGGYTCGGSYCGYTGGGSYCGYSGDDGQGYSCAGSYKDIDKRFGAEQKLVI